jgi:predicted ArsR family transcriptional regulator
MPKIVTVRCGHCHGMGRVELTGEALSTLKAVTAAKREITGAELGKILGATGMAMNNRLVKLEEYGLVLSRRWGRQRFYKAVKS